MKLDLRLGDCLDILPSLRGPTVPIALVTALLRALREQGETG